MKEYRLASWPDVPVQFQRTGHRRILGAMSHRHLSIAQLVECSGLGREDVLAFIEMLRSAGHVSSRDNDVAPDAAPGPFGWLRRAITSATSTER